MWEPAIRLGGPIGAAKGLSDLRGALRVTITAVGGESSFEEKADRMSSAWRGDPEDAG